MIGAARAVSDVLMYQPDFVGIDFSVNDDPTDFFKEIYEGVLRKVLTWTSEPAVVLLNNVYYDTGINAQEQHVIKFLEKVKEEAKEGIKECTKTDFPVPLTGNAYEHAQRQRRKHHSI